MPSEKQSCARKVKFFHTVSAENRFFERALKNMIFSRDRLQKFRKVSLFQLFYSMTFLVQKTLLAREKVCPGAPNNEKCDIGRDPLGKNSVFAMGWSKSRCFCRADRVSPSIFSAFQAALTNPSEGLGPSGRRRPSAFKRTPNFHISTPPIFEPRALPWKHRVPHFLIICVPLPLLGLSAREGSLNGRLGRRNPKTLGGVG